MKRADRKKDWAIKTRVDKLFDQITFRSNVVYLSILVFILFAVCDMCIKDWVYRNFFFVLCLHFSYYIIWNRNVSPRFVRISVFFSFLWCFHTSRFTSKRFFDGTWWEIIRSIYAKRIGYDLLIFGKMIIHTTFDLDLVT